MRGWTYTEYCAVSRVLQNTSSLSLEEEHRVYLDRARAKDALNFRLSLSDNEKRAVAKAIKNHLKTCENLLLGYPKRHNAQIKLRRQMETLEKARTKLIAAITDEK